MNLETGLQELNQLEVELKNSMIALSENDQYKRMIELDNQIEDIKASLKMQAKEFLKEAKITTIDTDLVRITLAKRKNFKAEKLSEIDAKLLDIKLDTKKVSNFMDLYGELPAGVKMTETEYIIWKDK